MAFLPMLVLPKIPPYPKYLLLIVGGFFIVASRRNFPPSRPHDEPYGREVMQVWWSQIGCFFDVEKAPLPMDLWPTVARRAWSKRLRPQWRLEADRMESRLKVSRWELPSWVWLPISSTILCSRIRGNLLKSEYSSASLYYG